MDAINICLGCGKQEAKLQELPFSDPPDWFVKCPNCSDMATIVYQIPEDAIKSWNKKWGYEELYRLQITIDHFEEVNASAFHKLTEDERELKRRFEQLLNAYVKMRLDYSGSWGNLSPDARRFQLINEIKHEMKWQ